MAKKQAIIPVERIEKAILIIRGQRVMLDSDLAELYGITTKRLNEGVRRNVDRFPDDFMFQLTEEEYTVLRSQFATSKKGRGGRRFMPYVFTEHGAVMLASVINTPIAVNASIQVVRAFVRLRYFLASRKEFASRFAALEKKYEGHDEKFKLVFEAIRRLMALPEPRPKPIGFKPGKK